MEAGMNTIINAQLDEGFSEAGAAMDATDFEEKSARIAFATAILKPFVGKEHGRPDAAFCIGLMARNMGVYAYSDPALTEDEQYNDSAAYFAEAARYLKMAADMADTRGDFIPARAKSLLADLYEDGVLDDGAPNVEQAFALRWEAAEAGFAEAQINLAYMYWYGIGTLPSPQNARKWIEAALQNQNQLPPEMLTAATWFHGTIANPTETTYIVTRAPKEFVM